MISRTKREEVRERRGSRRTAKRKFPKLARWAGVGVFVLGAAMACDGDEEPVDIADTGFVWVAPSGCWANFLKVGNNSGKVVRVLDLGEEAIPCKDLAAGARSGDLYVLISGLIKRYDCRGELIYEFETNGDGFAVDEIHDTLWTYDWFYLRLRSAANHEVRGSVKYEPEWVTDTCIDATDGGIWIAGTGDSGTRPRIVKYYPSLENEFTVDVEGKPEHIAVNPNNSDLWVSWPKNTAEGMRWMVGRYSNEGHYYGSIVCDAAVLGLVTNENTNGCFVQFKNGIREYAPSRAKVGSWPVEGVTTMAAGRKTGDLFVTNNPSRRERYVQKIAVESGNVDWRIPLTNTDGEHLVFCTK